MGGLTVIRGHLSDRLGSAHTERDNDQVSWTDLLHVDVFLKGTATKMTFNLKKEQEEGIQFVITSSQCVDCPSYASLYLGSASSGQGAREIRRLCLQDAYQFLWPP